MFGQEVLHFPSSEVRMRLLSDRLAHNLMVTGSNPVPTTKKYVLSVTYQVPLEALLALRYRLEALWKQEGVKSFAI